MLVYQRVMCLMLGLTHLEMDELYGY
jgi:hypothetical protein